MFWAAGTVAAGVVAAMTLGCAAVSEGGGVTLGASAARDASSFGSGTSGGGARAASGRAPAAADALTSTERPSIVQALFGTSGASVAALFGCRARALKLLLERRFLA